MKKKKWMLAVALPVTILLLLSSCRGPQSASDSEAKLVKLRIGVDAGTFSASYRIADLKGYYGAAQSTGNSDGHS